MKNREPVVIVAAKRSAIGRFGGALKSFSAVDLAEQITKATIDDEMIARCEWVVAGQVLQAACGMNPARQVALRVGIAKEVPACTVNMVCGSGMKAVADIVEAIAGGRIECGLALGMESMSQSPFYSQSTRWGAKFGESVLTDAIVKDGLTDPGLKIAMGETAERIAKEYKISRADQDQFALLSQQRASAAKNTFRQEIIGITTKVGSFEEDQHPRPDTTLEKLATLKPAFLASGSVTAGNSSGLNDGAAVIFLASASAAQRYGWKPLARVVDWTATGCDPAMMGLGPIGAISDLCVRIGRTIEDVDCFEINEAFAAQTLACIRELNLPLEKLNPRGGAIALGHPIGCSGTRILVSLLHHLIQTDAHLGMASLCIGGGMGISMCLERERD